MASIFVIQVLVLQHSYGFLVPGVSTWRPLRPEETALYGSSNRRQVSPDKKFNDQECNFNNYHFFDGSLLFCIQLFGCKLYVMQSKPTKGELGHGKEMLLFTWSQVCLHICLWCVFSSIVKSAGSCDKIVVFGGASTQDCLVQDPQGWYHKLACNMYICFMESSWQLVWRVFFFFCWANL